MVDIILFCLFTAFYRANIWWVWWSRVAGYPFKMMCICYGIMCICFGYWVRWFNFPGIVFIFVANASTR